MVENVCGVESTHIPYMYIKNLSRHSTYPSFSISTLILKLEMTIYTTHRNC